MTWGELEVALKTVPPLKDEDLISLDRELLERVLILETRVEELVTRNKELEAENSALRTENQALRARLGTNSSNSGKPPSSDGPGVKPHPKSQRQSSGRKPGGQPGHVGHALRLVDDPDEVKVHTPSHCKACEQDLEDAPTTHTERRQVVDVPPVKARVVEYQAETKRCLACGAETTAPFPVGVEAPAQYGPGVVTVAVYLNQESFCGRTAVRAHLRGDVGFI